MKLIVAVGLAVALFAVPLTGSAKTYSRQKAAAAPPPPQAPAYYQPVCQPACAPVVYEETCGPCIPNPFRIVGGVVSGVGCAVVGVGNAVGNIFSCNPCGPCY